MRKTLTLFIASLLALTSFADDRSEQEMQTIALQALAHQMFMIVDQRRQ